MVIKVKGCEVKSMHFTEFSVVFSVDPEKKYNFSLIRIELDPNKKSSGIKSC